MLISVESWLLFIELGLERGGNWQQSPGVQRNFRCDSPGGLKANKPCRCIAADQQTTYYLDLSTLNLRNRARGPVSIPLTFFAATWSRHSGSAATTGITHLLFRHSIAAAPGKSTAGRVRLTRATPSAKSKSRKLTGSECYYLPLIPRAEKLFQRLLRAIAEKILIQDNDSCTKTRERETKHMYAVRWERFPENNWIYCFCPGGLRKNGPSWTCTLAVHI